MYDRSRFETVFSVLIFQRCVRLRKHLPPWPILNPTWTIWRQCRWRPILIKKKEIYIYIYVYPHQLRLQVLPETAVVPVHPEPMETRRQALKVRFFWEVCMCMIKCVCVCVCWMYWCGRCGTLCCLVLHSWMLHWRPYSIDFFLLQHH